MVLQEPSDEKLELAQVRGREAEQRLSDPLLVEAFENWERLIHHRWENSKPAQKEEREELYRLLHAGKAFRAYLTRVVTTGKVAEKTAAARAADGGSGKSDRSEDQ